MSNISFTFLGKDSYTDYGITILRRPANPLPKRDVIFSNVQGRDGSLTNDLGTYDNFTLKVECILTNQANYQAQFRAIRAWLAGGVGELVFSDETDVKYKAIAANKIDFEQLYLNLGAFILMFECQPLKYAVSNTVIEKTSSPATFDSPTGVHDGIPSVKVTGSGAITFTLNGTTVSLAAVSSYETVDSLLMDCYKDAVLKNSDMTGDFPMLISGTNNLTWTGTVTKIEITPNWRYV
jgi:predicted phage tail component-like protein